jgi:hypothetical protein
MLQFNYNKKKPLAKKSPAIYTGLAWKTCAISPKPIRVFGVLAFRQETF